tara:strand:- start:46 stop:435 length:390 start_codon:yes stop_codon:yes gene_type:complete
MNVPSKEKFLYFTEQAAGTDFDAANDLACYPVSKLVGFTNPTTKTQLELMFTPMLESTGGTNHDKVLLNITENKHKEVIQAILNEIAFGNDTIIVIADNFAGEFLSIQPNAATPVAITSLQSITVTAVS